MNETPTGGPDQPIQPTEQGARDLLQRIDEINDRLQAIARDFENKLDAIEADLDALRASTQNTLAGILAGKHMALQTAKLKTASEEEVQPSYAVLYADTEKGSENFQTILSMLDGDSPNSMKKFVPFTEETLLFIDACVSRSQSFGRRNLLVILGLLYENRHRSLTTQECSDITGYALTTIPTGISEINFFGLLDGSGYSIVNVGKKTWRLRSDSKK